MAIDPKLVSIKEAKDLPTSEAKSTSDFLFFEDQVLKKSPMSNIYDKFTSGIKGVATQTNAPTPYTAEDFPNGLFETYVVRTPLTMPNNWGSAVTQLELDNNSVYFDVKNGVVTKATQPIKGAYQSYLNTTTDSPKKTEAEWVASLKTSLNTVFDKNNNVDGATMKATDDYIFQPSTGDTYLESSYLTVHGSDGVGSAQWVLFLKSDDVRIENINISQIKLNARVAGDVRIAKYTLSGTTATVTQKQTATLTTGNNTVVLTDKVLAPNEELCLIFNTTNYLARIFKNDATSVGYKSTFVATADPSTVAGVTLLNIRKWGIQFISESEAKIDVKIKSVVQPLIDAKFDSIPVYSPKTTFDKNNNADASTMKATNDYLLEDQIVASVDYLEPDYNTLNSSDGVGSAQWIMPIKDDRVRTETINIQSLKINARVAGDIRVCKCSLSGTTLNITQKQTITVAVGDNTIVLTDKALAPNEFLGFIFNNTTWLGRFQVTNSASVGYKSTFAGYATDATFTTGITLTYIKKWGVKFISEAYSKDPIITTKIKEVANPIIDAKLIDVYDSKNLFSFNLDNVFPSLSKNLKPLTKIGILGDSLLANPVGGAIPSVEALTQRPMRLGESNNVARRIYDYLSWNKPDWRRLDDVAWTKSGTWTTQNDSAIFEPTYSNETYHKTSSSGAYVEISVPSGKENFAIIVREYVGMGKMLFSLNGSAMPIGNGIATFDSASDRGETGNPYKTIEFKNLPAGANTIRISKEANTLPIYIWGGFYWSGNTVIVQNVAHGGHTMYALYLQHFQGEVATNNFDAIMFQITLMNEVGLQNIETSKTYLKLYLDYLKNKDSFITSCNVMGNNAGKTVNFFIENGSNIPWVTRQNIFAEVLKNIVYQYKLPYLDLYKIADAKIKAMGGTAENGDGSVFTTDGQHGNELGTLEWFNSVKAILKDTVIKNS